MSRAGAQVRSRLRRAPATRKGQLIILLVLLVVWGASSSELFATRVNFFNVSSGLVEKAMIALPLALVIVSGEIDISVESMVGLGGAVFGQLVAHQVPVLLAVVITVAVGLVGGALNAVLVTRVGLPSLVVTLGTYALYRGLAFIILGPAAVSTFPTWFGTVTRGYVPGTSIPYTLVLLLVLALVTGMVLHLTPFGRQVYFIGQNAEAALFAGVDVAKVKSTLFVTAGGIAALAGVVLDGRLSSARADNGQGFVLDVLAAVLLGGVVIAGGRGSVLGVVLAITVIAALRSVLTLQSVQDQTQNVVVGLLLIISVIAPSAGMRLRALRSVPPPPSAPPPQEQTPPAAGPAPVTITSTPDGGSA